MNKLYHFSLALIFSFFATPTISYAQTTIDFNSVEQYKGYGLTYGDDTPTQDPGEVLESVVAGGFLFSINNPGDDKQITGRTGMGYQGTACLYDNNQTIGAITQWTIRKMDNGAFQFRGIFLKDGGFADVSGSITGYKNGNPTGTVSNVSFSRTATAPLDFSADPIFFDVDEIRITGDDINFYLDQFTYGQPTGATNSPPQVSGVSPSPVVEEDSPVALAGMSVSDVEGDNQTLTFTVTGGTVSLGTSGITFGGSGNGSSNFTASGTLANINAALDAATFTPTPNLFGTNAGTISFVSNDGTANSNTASVTFDIIGVNNPPVVSNTLGNDFWTEGNPPTTIKPLIGVSDPDGDNITKAIITNLLFVPGDELSVASPGPYSVDYNTSAGVLTLSGIGTATEMQNALRTVSFRNSTDDPGLGNTRNTRILTFFVEDEHGATSAAVDNPGIFVTSVNDAPSIVAPLSIDAMEDVPKALTGIGFTDPDAGLGHVTASFSVASGSLSAISVSGVTVGGTSSSLVLEGSLSDINAFIADGRLTFTTASNATSDVNLNINISDNGNTGSGGALTDQTVVTLSVTAVNDAPVNTVPGTQQTDQGAALVFSSGNGNLISVIDVDAGSNAIQISLTATDGLISLSGTAGLAFSLGSGVDDVTMMFTGTIVDINAALNGMTFSPTASFNGLAGLSITSDDQGNSGSGGAQTDTDVISITVNSVNPMVTNVTSSTASGTYKGGDVIALTVTFDQQVLVNTSGGVPTLLLETGSVDRVATYVSGSGSNTLTFSYTVQQGDVSSDLDYTGTNALSLNGATVRGGSGLDVVLTLPAVGSANSIAVQRDIVIDGIAPTVNAVSVPANGIYRAADALDFMVQFSESVVVGGTPYIGLTIGTATVQAVYTSGSATNSLLFRYIVQDGDRDMDGVTLGSTIVLNGGSIRDAAGNNTVLALTNVDNTSSVFVNTAHPSVALSTSSASPTNLAFTASIVFSEAVTGFTVGDIAATNATLSNLQTADNITYTVLVTPLAEGAVNISVPADAAVNIGGNGNTASNTLNLAYDGTAPTVIVQNLTVYLDASGTVSITGADIDNGSSDVSGIANITLSQTDFDCSHVGDNTVTLTVADIVGNSASADASVTVIDDIAPAVMTQDVTVYLGVTGTVSITATDINNGSADACGIQSMVVSQTEFDLSNLGDNTVTLTVTDVNGNISSEAATVTIARIVFADGSFVYDGTAKSLAITGTLPAGTSVAYTDNSRTDVGTHEVTATITGSNFTTLVLTADLTVTPGDVSGLTFEDGSFVFDGTAKSLAITGTLPDGTSVAYTDNSRTDVGTQEVTATITGSNYTNLVLTADLTVTAADVSGITFDDASFTYDGTEKTVEITGTLPAGTSVAYSDNSRTNIGTQEATATITGPNFTTLVLTADLTITPADITGITFEDGSFVFDGTAKSLAITGTLPAGTSVAYTDNSRTDVGTQEVTATITGANFTTLVLTADLTVTPGDVSGLTFADGSFVYDGTAKSLAITGTLPAGTSVAYTDNSRTDVGTQEVTATITGPNFTTLVLTADLTITPADIPGITFADGSFVYDGTAKSLAITGTLPAGTSVAYTDNSRTDVGTHEVTATITGPNFTTLVLTADLTVTPADIAGLTFADGSFVYDGTAKSLAITGTLPSGTSVAYTDNSRTNVGTKEVTATITGANFTTLVLTADLTVTPAGVSGLTFEDGSFVFDGTAKSLAITGTLPDGTSVAYTDNSRTVVGTQEATATITGSNFTTLVLTADLTVTPADVSGLTFDDASFTYDGTEKTIEITGTLPAGTSVAYTDNSRTDVGTQEVTATITGPNFTTLVLTADLTITPADIPGITFADGSFVFDGTAKSLAITGTLPAGTSVAYTDNSRTDVSTQEVTATITGPNFTTLVLTADLTITPADITGITFEDGSFVYDGTAKSLAITGTLPAGTSVAYTDNSRTNVGTQEATATITGSNFTTLVLTADLTVTPADITGITFGDGSFVFDGTAKSLAITGTLPAGTSVAYTDNSRTDVGTQEVTATISGSNYTTSVLTADLTVTPADITGITFEDGSFVFDGTAKSLAITGTLPGGTSVAYTDNSRTDVGTQEVTATISGSNFTTLVLTADLTVTPADVSGLTFEDGSFVYDGTAKSLAITGALSEGTSVAYTDNSRTDVGTQEVTATITGTNFTTLVLTADLTITPADIPGITFADGSFVYDGTAKSLAITGALPDGTSVAYTDNSRTDVGTQEVTATITGSNFTTLVLTADLAITPADLSGITFADGSFVYDGTGKSLAITGALPDGTSVAYTDNSRTDVGTQEVTATITGSNFTTLVLTADLAITPADITGITFADGSFVFDGTGKSLAITGTLPAGTSAAYTDNSRTDVGTQEATATISGSNFTTLILEASLTVTPSELTVIADPGQSKLFGEADPEFGYMATGFVLGEDQSILKGKLSRAAGENIGLYPITIGTLEAGSNYTVNYTGADFEILSNDTDGDGVPDDVEIIEGTNPSDPDDYLDADGDGVPDHVETEQGTDPNDPSDYQDVDGDQVPDYVEEREGTDPDNNTDFLDEDKDGVPDYVQVRAITEFVTQNLEVFWGTELNELNLQPEVLAITGRDEFINLPVNWNLTGYDPLMAGATVYTGTVDLPVGVFNPYRFNPTLSITVLEKLAPEDVILNENEFVGIPGQFFQKVGAFTVIDPSDDIHTLSLPEGEGDNAFFEVNSGILFWNSADQQSGRVDFTVILRVQDRAGNELSKAFAIRRLRTPLDQLEVPNTFTPNADGVNDTWGVPALRYYNKVRIQVFDNGGNRLFYTENPDVKWDGTFKGIEQPVSSYVYVIEVGETGETRRGMLNLLRK